MKAEVIEIRTLLEGISCLCAEGVEFMTRIQLAERVQRLTLKAIEECDSVLLPRHREVKKEKKL